MDESRLPWHNDAECVAGIGSYVSREPSSRSSVGGNHAETSGEDDGAMGTRRIQVGCEFVHLAEVETPVVFHVQPIESGDVAVKLHRWRSQPPIAIREYADMYGNPGARGVLPAGRSSFRYSAVATVPDATEEADGEAQECAPDALPD